MDIYEIRRANARLLASRFELQIDFAKAMGESPNHVSQIIGENVKNHRRIGTAWARKIEESFSMPHGWMDQDHGDESVIVDLGATDCKHPKDIYDIRRINTKILAEDFPTFKEFAERIGREPSYVGQMISENVKFRKNIGDQLARLIESTFHKAYGWLDQEHGGKDECLLGPDNQHDAIVMVVNAVAEQGCSADPDVMAKLISLALLELEETGAVDKKNMARVVRVLVGKV